MISGVLKGHHNTISIATRLADILIIWLGGVIAFYLRFGQTDSALPFYYSGLIVIGGLVAAVIFPMLQVYGSWRARGMLAPAARVLSVWLVTMAILVSFLFFAKQAQTFSRLWLLEWTLISSIGLVALRLIVYSVLRSFRQRGFNRRSAVVVGEGALASDLIARSRVAVWSGYRVVGAFDSGSGSVDTVADHELQPLRRLAHFVSSRNIDEVWIALPLERSGEVREVLAELNQSTATVRYVPDLFGLFLLNHGISDMLGVPVIDLTASPMVGINRAIKSFEDRLVSLMILVLVSPLMLAIAIAIKCTSKGPVLFKQHRHGWDCRPTKVYKFRTMVVHREEGGRATPATRDDPRVTPVGRFLRRTSLDELPQFLNVLQGRMSIVGPRPHAMSHNDEYRRQITQYMTRHCVKPGITGWAQVNGYRGEVNTLDTMRKRVELDLFYIDNWSLWFDFRIIFLTIFKGFFHKNAY